MAWGICSMPQTAPLMLCLYISRICVQLSNCLHALAGVHTARTLPGFRRAPVPRYCAVWLHLSSQLHVRMYMSRASVHLDLVHDAEARRTLVPIPPDYWWPHEARHLTDLPGPPPLDDR